MHERGLIIETKSIANRQAGQIVNMEDLTEASQSVLSCQSFYLFRSNFGGSGGHTTFCSL